MSQDQDGQPSDLRGRPLGVVTASRQRAVACVVVTVLILGLRPARGAAWVFSEHTRITQRALEKLRQLPRTGPTADWLRIAETELQLCACAGCHDEASLATLPSLAGDHSCSPGELAHVLASRDGDGAWVRAVLEVAARTDRALHAAGADADEREEIRRRMHLDMQAVDPRYLQRALVDDSHFQLARELSLSDLTAYLGFAFAATRDANATATYVNYHLVAARLAAQALAEQVPVRRNALVARAMLFELFALHFLEDAFASGHFVGHWGNASVRMGSHDYYARAGVVASRWSTPSKSYVAHGDAFLSDVECEMVSDAVAQSLLQMLTPEVIDALSQAAGHAFTFPDYDSCTDPQVPPGMSALASDPSLGVILERTPIPAVRYPALQRARAENGWFFGAAAAAGYGIVPVDGQVFQIRAGLRLGYGAAGIVDDPLNAQAFVDLAFVGDYLVAEDRHRPILGYDIRLRAPGYLFFLDGAVAILLSQALQARCPACLDWAAAAAGGGVGRLWRGRMLTGTISWQFSLLRDVSLHLYPNEADHHSYRAELQLPLITVRNLIPITGESFSQSTDVYFDIGPSLTWSAGHRSVAPGVFVSLATATRVFP